MDNRTENEQEYLHRIDQRLSQLRDYLHENMLDPNADVGHWYDYLAQIRAIQGNINNDLSFLSMLLAKNYLANRFDIGEFDAAAKAQGAPGLDIDIMTVGGERIVGEIKTTVPYTGAKNDLGAKQKESFQHDFDKLNNAVAEYKFFFVTDSKTYEIVQQRYAARIPNVEIILLA